MKLTMVGHSTLLVEASGSRIIVDPFFAASSLSISRRTAPPSLTAEEAAARCDLVLVTHNHPDHCDPRFFDVLAPGVPVVVPDGFRFLGGYQARQSVERVRTWDSWSHGALRVACTPAAHPGTSCGFVVSDGESTLYLAGDTNNAAFFSEVRDRLHPDAAALPLRVFRFGPGLTSIDVVDAVDRLGVSSVIGIHVHLQMTTRLLALPDPSESIRETLHQERPAIRFEVPMPGDAVDIIAGGSTAAER